MSVDQEACGRAGPGVDSGTSELDRWVGVRPTRYALWRNTGSWCLGVLCLLTIIASAAPSRRGAPAAAHLTLMPILFEIPEKVWNVFKLSVLFGRVQHFFLAHPPDGRVAEADQIPPVLVF